MWWMNDDEGSGTALGVGITAAVAVVATVVIFAASFLICKAHVRSDAEQTALAAAQYLQLALHDKSRTYADACAVARGNAHHMYTKLESCTIHGENVDVSMSAQPSISILPRVQIKTRAGPVECVPRNR
ncbi:Rv3654c family TadE-like protein [Alloscardovia venturai]|uniref:Rv3654c family TadE-like protein n=1 Tax=Alloscardovia venturai TaxID=1769421 RepID=A0ABW2Y4U8_9BIFI